MRRLRTYLLPWFFSILPLSFLRPKPSIILAVPLSTAREPSGTSFVIVEPAPVYAPLPIFTGATRLVLQPMKASSPITVRNFFSPS